MGMSLDSNSDEPDEDGDDGGVGSGWDNDDSLFLLALPDLVGSGNS